MRDAVDHNEIDVAARGLELQPKLLAKGCEESGGYLATPGRRIGRGLELGELQFEVEATDETANPRPSGRRRVSERCSGDSTGRGSGAPVESAL